MRSVEYIRTAEEVHETPPRRIVGAKGAACTAHCLRSRFITELPQLSGNFIQRLLPAYPLPFPFATTAGALKGIVYASRVFMVHESDLSPSADTTPAEGVAMMEAPYFAAFNVTHAFMRDMLGRNRGVIIHVGAAVSIFTFPSCTGYAAARWALRGLNESLCEDLHGTGVHSCHVVFGKVSSPYFDHNPGVEEKIPAIARTVRTISPEECAKVIAKAARRPRRQVVYPLMLRMYVWSYALFPWFTRWLLRTTGAKR